MVRTRTSYLRLQQSTIVDDVLLQRSTLGTQRAAIDRMIWIAFDVNDLGGCVFSFVAERVDDYAAAYRTVRASAAGFSCAVYFERLCLRVSRREVEAEGGSSDSSDKADLDESSSRDFHKRDLR